MTYQDWLIGREFSNGVPVTPALTIDVPTSAPRPGWTVGDATGPGDPGVYEGYGTRPVEHGSLGLAPKSARGPKGGV